MREKVVGKVMMDTQFLRMPSRWCPYCSPSAKESSGNVELGGEEAEAAGIALVILLSRVS